MAKDSKARKLHKALKREGVGIKYKKSKGSMQEWQARYNKIAGK